MLFQQEGCTKSTLGSGSSLRDGSPFICAWLESVPKHRTQCGVTTVSLVTYLTLQVTGIDSFLQDELKD